MNIALKVQENGFAEAEIMSAVADALRSQAQIAQLRRDYYQSACREFEQTYHMNSDEFIARFESGELGDDAHWFTWFALKQGLDIWERRFRILEQITL